MSTYWLYFECSLDHELVVCGEHLVLARLLTDERAELRHHRRSATLGLSGTGRNRELVGPNGIIGAGTYLLDGGRSKSEGALGGCG
jgi:hypothetical protein